MKRITKLLVLIISLLLLASCGQKQEEAIEINEETVEVVAVRNIVVSEVNGTVSVTHGDGQKLNAYEGMSLSDGDDVVVGASSNITLSIDSDKHIFAEENSHFWLYASGSQGKTKTIIRLEEGSVLCDINEKLADEESFDIQTASSTMSVRGTVFRVCLLKGNDNSVFDLVEVYDGKVWSNIDSTSDNLTLEPGQCALIRNIEDGQEVVYVVQEDIDDKFIEETGLNISLENVENKEEGVLRISLENVPVDTLARLIKIIEEGTELAISKEEIQQVEEEKKQEIVKEEVHVHNFVLQSQTESTCSTAGRRVYTCIGCGETRVESLALVEHTPEKIYGHGATCTGDGLTDGSKCSVCGTILEEQSTISAMGHKSYLDNDGITHKCSVCGTILGYSSEPERYAITSFSSITDDDYTSEYDSKNSKLTYTFKTKGILRKEANDGSVTTVNDADIVIKHIINDVFSTDSSSLAAKSFPTYEIEYYYGDDQVDVTSDAKRQHETSDISQSFSMILVSNFSEFKVSTIPDSLSDDNASIHKTGDNLYKVELALTADATFTPKPSGSTTPININYKIIFNVPVIDDKNCGDVARWSKQTFCFDNIELDGDIVSAFATSDVYDNLIAKVSTYVLEYANSN